VSQNLEEAKETACMQYREMLEASARITQNGYAMRIVDLPSLMLRQKKFDVRQYIKELEAGVYIIEAGSVTQIPEAVEISGYVDQYHPKSSVLLCGYAASCYCRDLINLSCIDMIMRGNFDADIAVRLLKAVKTKRLSSLDSIIWKDKRGNVHENAITSIVRTRNINIAEYYGEAVAQKRRYGDSGALNILSEWLRNPSIDVSKPGSAADLRTPEDVYFDIVETCRFSPGEVHVKGDIRSPGKPFAVRLLNLLQQKTVNNTLVFDITDKADGLYVREIARSVPRFRLNIAPGSHDEKLRLTIGCTYSDSDLEATIAAALKAAPERVDVSFFSGLPGQTEESVRDTVAYCEYLLRRFDGNRRLSISITPYRPVEGSSLNDTLERYGYIQSLNPFPSCSGVPGGMNKGKGAGTGEFCMEAEQVTMSVYESSIRLVRLKNKYAQLGYREAEIEAMRYESAMKMTERLYRAMKNGKKEDIDILKPEISRISNMGAGTYKAVKTSLMFSRPQNALALCRIGINGYLDVAKNKAGLINHSVKASHEAA
jgi:hypothetical protein